MADGTYPPDGETAAAINRRGPMRPEQLTSPRARLSGRWLARGFMGADLSFLLLAAAWCDAAQGWSHPEAMAGAILCWALLIAGGVYRLSPRETRQRHLSFVAGAAAAGWTATQAAGGLLHPSKAPFTDLSWGAALAGLTVLHALWLQIVGRLRRAGKLTPNIVIVGATPSAERLIRWALDQKGAVNIIGVFDDRGQRSGRSLAGVPVLGKTAELIDNPILPYVDRVIITVPATAGRRIEQLAELLRAIPNPITLLMAGEADGDTASIQRISDFGLQQISGAESPLVSRLVKRATDIVVGGVAVICLAPVMAAIAVAIRLDSPGPAFFRQKRQGYFNEPFTVYKFRSMRTEVADAHARRQVTAGDDRITRLGRFIRNTSIDELPQLLNVVRGEMSLVGPRPHAIGMLVQGEDARSLLGTYAHRHRIKPGLTGWAAVNGSRGPVDSPELVRRRVELDLEYIERQSLRLDLWIMLRTLPCLLGDKLAVR